jgi:Ca2+-binding RTX toxin-like protein
MLRHRASGARDETAERFTQRPIRRRSGSVAVGASLASLLLAAVGPVRAFGQESTPVSGTGPPSVAPSVVFEGQSLTPVAGGVAGLGLDIEISRLFGGTGGSTFIPPDTMASVGPDHIVEMINGNYQSFNKVTGASIEDMTLDAFWTNKVGLAIVPANGGRFDPRVVYDTASQRWFAVSIDRAVDADNDGVNETSNNLFVARSDTTDPTGDWDGFMVDADTVGVEEFHDYPTLGIDADGVYSCTQDFGDGGNETCYSFPKADLLLAAPTAANLTRFEATPAGLPAVAGSWQPAIDFGASDGRAALLGSTGTALRRTSIVGAGGAGATLTAAVAITGDPGHAAPPAARQPPDDVGESNTIENVAPRFVGNVFELGNSLWAVHSVQGTGANAALRWYEINETTNTVIQTGLIDDTTRDFHEPSIAVNAHGDVLIGYTCSGPSLAASVCVSLGQTAAGVTTFQPPTVLQTGAGDYYRDFCTPTVANPCNERNRWGDYSATVIDPVNPCRFWTFQEYTAVAATGDVGPGENESGNWGVRAVDLTFQQCQIDLGLRDFGDLPDTYGTVLASNGARHIHAFGTPQLGAGLDVETNGQPTADALGDDANVSDDEDGVVLPPGVIPGFSHSATVTASAAGGRLDAWMDFDRSGTFEAGERIANGLPLAAGANDVTFSVPGTAVLGTTGARFRISTAGGLAPTGQAPDGEVEDYLASIVTLEAFCGLAPPPGAIVGTAGADDLTGTAADDVIFGLAGNDRLQGLDGNDILCGGDDVDYLIGGDGNDSMVGGPGVDRLDGGAGNDTLLGGPGTDRLDGGPGTNSNDGGTEVDQCFNPSSGSGCP